MQFVCRSCLIDIYRFARTNGPLPQLSDYLVVLINYRK